MGLAACGSAEGETSGGGAADGCPEGPIQWWVQMPYSGPVAAVGEASTDAMQAAVDVINEDGGVLGRDIELVRKDTGGDPTKAVSNVQELVASGEKPVMVTPGLLSGETLAGLPLVNNAKLANVVITSNPESNDPEKYPYTFNLGSTAAPFAIPAVVEQLRAEGYEKFAVAASDDATGIAQLDALEAAAEDGDFTVTSVRIPPDAIDAIPQLSKLQAQDPDVLVYASGPGPLTPAVLSARQTMGWDIPAHGVPVSASASLAGLTPQTLDGVTMTVPKFGISGSEIQQGEAYQTYLAALEDEFGGADKLVMGPEIYANPYSMIAAGAAAIEKAGSCDPDEVTAAFQSLEVSDAPLWFTSSGFDFTDDNHGVAFAPDDYESIPASSKLTAASFVVE